MLVKFTWCKDENMMQLLKTLRFKISWAQYIFPFSTPYLKSIVIFVFVFLRKAFCSGNFLEDNPWPEKGKKSEAMIRDDKVCWNISKEYQSKFLSCPQDWDKTRRGDHVGPLCTNRQILKLCQKTKITELVGPVWTLIASSLVILKFVSTFSSNADRRELKYNWQVRTAPSEALFYMLCWKLMMSTKVFYLHNNCFIDGICKPYSWNM